MKAKKNTFERVYVQSKNRIGNSALPVRRFRRPLGV